MNSRGPICMLKLSVHSQITVNHLICMQLNQDKPQNAYKLILHFEEELNTNLSILIEYLVKNQNEENEKLFDLIISKYGQLYKMSFIHYIRFFFLQKLRKKEYEKAFEIAKKFESPEMYEDIYLSAKKNGFNTISVIAFSNTSKNFQMNRYYYDQFSYTKEEIEKLQNLSFSLTKHDIKILASYYEVQGDLEKSSSIYQDDESRYFELGKLLSNLKSKFE